MTWSIRLKFLLVMVGLLVTGLGVYLFMAVTVFKSDKTQLVFDLNRSQVSNLTSELETLFSGVSEKLKVFALLPKHLQDQMAEDLFSGNSDVIAVAMFKTLESETPEKILHHERFLETYGLSAADFDTEIRAQHFPIKEIQKSGEDIWNASLKNGPPLIAYGRLVIQQDENGAVSGQWLVVGFVKLDRFLKSVSMVQLSQIFVSNVRGEVLVHPDAGLVLKKPSLADDPLFQEALKARTRVSVVHRQVGNGGVMAALAKGFGNRIFVVAQASEAQVFAVVRDFSVRTLLFGMLVLTIVILAAFLLSRSLTGNIAMLAERMEGAARGDLSTHIHLHGRDETVILANTFNQMIEDLRTSRDALEEVNRDLDQKVKDRTAELEIQNRKVKEVQEALLRTTRLASVGEIAGRTAHEVLNPLTILLTRVGVIQKRLKATDSASVEVVNQILSAWISEFKEGGFEKLLASWQSASQVYPGKTLFEEDLENIRSGLTGVSDGEAHLGKDIQFIKEEGERIAKIINNMRRLGISKSDLRKESIHTILKDCCEIMADLFQEKGFLIDRRFEAQFDECSVDRDEVVQAVTNLMRNSLQALAERAGQGDSSVRPFVRLQTHNEDGKLVIDIEDNGVGIRDEHQQELFKSSFTTKSHDEGTGLGLGIARRFIRGHGGDIDFVSSVPLDKTVFRIVLPLAADDQQGAVA